MILSAPKSYDVTRGSRDMALAHPALSRAWAAFRADAQMAGFPLLVLEVFRYDARQQWLYGQGRTGQDLGIKGIDPLLARPDMRRVTEAWSAATSAHGFCVTDANGVLQPAAAAIDCAPVGPDGKPFTGDDDWKNFTGWVEGVANQHGLRHFRNAAGVFPDMPHLQLVTWSDAQHTVVTPPPLPAA